ncbi:MAG TPA: hypothetical protein VN999_07250, partial [Thermoanaerobaculia bacterium]|nr:hypothetical protein [Thermoanaerobaculia bacterium]
YQNLASIAPITGALGAAGAAAFTGNAGTGGGTGAAGAGGAVGRRGLGSLLFGAARGPSLLYAYAEADRIVFAGHSEAGPMGLNLETLAGFGGILGGIERAHGAAMLRTARTVRRGGH